MEKLHTQDHEYDGYLPGTIIGSNEDGTFKVEFDFGQFATPLIHFQLKRKQSSIFRR